MVVRSIATSANPRPREQQSRLVFPAPIIAGQRRTLATVQNGILTLCKLEISN
jgi:protein AFG1